MFITVHSKSLWYLNRECCESLAIIYIFDTKSYYKWSFKMWHSTKWTSYSMWKDRVPLNSSILVQDYHLYDIVIVLQVWSWSTLKAKYLISQVQVHAYDKTKSKHIFSFLLIGPTLINISSLNIAQPLIFLIHDVLNIAHVHFRTSFISIFSTYSRSNL